MDKDQEEKAIYKEREKYRQKAFVMMLEVAVIIAIPAFTALVLGKWLDSKNETGSLYLTIALIISFILSWIIIILKYIKLDKQVKKIDRKIKELKEKKDVSDSNSSR